MAQPLAAVYGWAGAVFQQLERRKEVERDDRKKKLVPREEQAMGIKMAERLKRGIGTHRTRRENKGMSRP
ncbi:hypothetical protein NDU88_006785 [Pleurodeles waltl]|uniref:Uncharacterized protein n=1 Tax=Pleurodeles waltl TaxID=8319 RepID=A0AAV7SQI5_PLEWA|nr:hypothetical protein NDU88_006785 [Pleurodeles waltl]